jgi:hypothetical protein
VIQPLDPLPSKRVHGLKRRDFKAAVRTRSSGCS